VGTYEADTRGEGWVAFAGVMIMIAGFLNLVFGIAALDDSSFFTDEGRYVIFDDLNTWGWFLLIVGIAQIVGAFSIWNRHMYGRMIGVLTASISAVVILFTVNAFPTAAFMLFILDILVIYGLVAHGGQPRSSA
jgi:uncharacterized membrane protein HdeD (DUF308 family)